jgi:undecaprenyl-diphosphatase
MTQFENIDVMILEFIQQNLHTPWLNNLAIFITTLGDGGLLWLLIAVVLLFRKQTRHMGIMVVLALIISTLLGEVTLKHLFLRPRPFLTYENFNPLVHPTGLYSFPSGHTASSFAVAGILIWGFKKYKVPILLVASLIALSRVFLLVHYPTDILAGIILGFLCSQLVIWMYTHHKYLTQKLTKH